jgi:hypothetical protein
MQGERVSVTIRFRGRGPLRFTFTIAQLAPAQPLLTLGQQQPSKLQHFVSAPRLLAPKVTVLKPAPQLPGDVFLTPLPSPIVHPESNNAITINPVGPGGPMILDGRGRLVWFKQLTPPDVATDLQIERYRGHRVLTWWQGGVTSSAFGLGEGVIADSAYRTIATVHAGNGYAMDLHEFRLAGGGDAVFTAYSPVLVHLAGTPAGSTSTLTDAIVQEVDIRTGLVVWEWHALGHIPLADSYATPATSADYDAFHINSIQPLAGGKLLISARDTSAVYELDQRTGRILWTLGGKASSFRLGRGARFWFQHDAEVLRTGEVSVFDDEGGPPIKAPNSRGLILRLNPARHTATVAAHYSRPQDTSPESEGDLQIVAGGNVFLGFGSEPNFSEFAPGGRMLFDARLPIDDGSYRVYRFAWSAQPRTRPLLGLTGVPGHLTVHVSWNGATGVRRWQVLAGRSLASLRPVRTVRKRGFETAIRLTGTKWAIVVRALDGSGRVLASSKTLGLECLGGCGPTS